ncbi:serine protease, S1-C subfamily, contains C-terminal PDZ domain [Natronincola peptidivorans]|uniref:Serine protease, S1-C subfamily, contains C-terminal PDZ domain n=1 Tax=Natronincola peptidivorans TaxID=426128 RepID=A0A1I0B4J9_9FIRM|nr:trypsin-like peptidase domain-containing protein [Natronincola peptidivorans]SET01291.1 serine protease, S1-C subfamily, contains C-terminal PDZ domain [Natronincola peptidivorans]
MDFYNNNYQNEKDGENQENNKATWEDTSIYPKTEFRSEPPLPPNTPRQKKTSKLSYIAVALLAAIFSSVISLTAAYMYLPQLLQHRGMITMPAPNITIEPQQDLTVYTAVAEKAMPSVVGITTVTLQRDVFFGTRRASGLGTGVIVDERGYILTNSHVVGDGNVEEVMVLLHDGSSVKAEVLWNERTLDLAVIKVEGTNLVPAELGNSDDLRVGEVAVAIGNPLGLNFERTLTQGVISGLNRSIPLGQGETIEDLIQTDASINPGNSGGPLLNAYGEVIGINTAKIQTGEGLGFAIPINTAKPIVDQFIEKGEFTRVLLGVRGINVESFEGFTGTRLKAEEGVYIVEVEANSVAEAHDIRPGDVIVGVGGNSIETMGQLIRELYRYRPGDNTTISILRNERELQIEVVL